MATLQVQGTEFTFSVLETDSKHGFWANTETEIKNEYIHYREVGKNLSRDELEEWIFCMFRLLAGAYGKEYSLSFERAGLAIDLYPHTKKGEEVSREERRSNDCVMAIRLLMKSKNKKQFLGGVYTLLLHRKEMERFAVALQEEFKRAFERFESKQGKYLFVGVSPKGYKGCNYWYLDESKRVQAGDFVWVRMGKRQIEQVVYVDSIKYCDDDTAPFDPALVKRILRKATQEEIR